MASTLCKYDLRKGPGLFVLSWVRVRRVRRGSLSSELLMCGGGVHSILLLPHHSSSLSVYSLFSYRVGLPPHNAHFPEVLMKNIGAAFFLRPDALPDVNHMCGMQCQIGLNKILWPDNTVVQICVNNSYTNSNTNLRYKTTL